jgi:hypothetical protein
MAQDGYTSSRPDASTRLPRMVKVPHRNTTECQYTKENPADPACAGCCHQKGEQPK